MDNLIIQFFFSNIVSLPMLDNIDFFYIRKVDGLNDTTRNYQTICKSLRLAELGLVYRGFKFLLISKSFFAFVGCVWRGESERQ